MRVMTSTCLYIHISHNKHTHTHTNSNAKINNFKTKKEKEGLRPNVEIAKVRPALVTKQDPIAQGSQTFLMP